MFYKWFACASRSLESSTINKSSSTLSRVISTSAVLSTSSLGSSTERLILLGSSIERVCLLGWGGGRKCLLGRYSGCKMWAWIINFFLFCAFKDKILVYCKINRNMLSFSYQMRCWYQTNINYMFKGL